MVQKIHQWDRTHFLRETLLRCFHLSRSYLQSTAITPTEREPTSQYQQTQKNIGRFKFHHYTSRRYEPLTVWKLLSRILSVFIKLMKNSLSPFQYDRYFLVVISTIKTTEFNPRRLNSGPSIFIIVMKITTIVVYHEPKLIIFQRGGGKLEKVWLQLKNCQSHLPVIKVEYFETSLEVK